MQSAVYVKECISFYYLVVNQSLLRKKWFDWYIKKMYAICKAYFFLSVAQFSQSLLNMDAYNAHDLR